MEDKVSVSLWSKSLFIVQYNKHYISLQGKSQTGLVPIIKDVGSLTFVEILLLLFSLLREYVCVVTPWPSLYEPVGIGAREPVAQRSQRNWMMHPGSVGMNPSSPWVTFHRCKRGDGRGPGHVHSPSPFAFPETAPGHVLPLQPIKGTVCARWVRPHRGLQPGTHVPHFVS